MRGRLDKTSIPLRLSVGQARLVRHALAYYEVHGAPVCDEKPVQELRAHLGAQLEKRGLKVPR